MKSSLWSVGLSLALLGLASIDSTGCGHKRTEPASRTGRLHVSLVGTSNSGVQYRLRQGVFHITGPSEANLFSEEGLQVGSLTVELTTGDYQVELLAGWYLEKAATDGSFASVKAILVSDNPVEFTIRAQEPTRVQFRFKAGDDVIQIGDGVLEITIAIDDGSGGAGGGGAGGGGAGGSGGATCNGDALDGGLCGVSCNAGYADCNGNASDGCEANLTNDMANCGGCGRVCPAGMSCNSGSCHCADSAQRPCDGVCVSVLTDSANCGGCGAACPVGSSCSGGVCTLAGLVFHCTFDSESAVTSPAVGAGGTISGGDFVAGYDGNAFAPTGNGQIRFPAGIIPAQQGTIELWVKLVGYQTTETIPWGAAPTLFTAYDGLASACPSGAHNASYAMHLSGNDGVAGGGLTAMAGCSHVATNCYSTNRTYGDVVGDTTAWHHYAVAWSESGIPGSDYGIQLMIDGVKVGNPYPCGQGHYFPTFPAPVGSLSLLAMDKHPSGQVLIDELRIWSQPKLSFP